MNKITFIKTLIIKKHLLLFFIMLSTKLYSQTIEIHTDTINQEDTYIIRKEIGVFKNEKLIEDYNIYQLYYLSWKFKGIYTEPESLRIIYHENGNIKEISNVVRGRKVGLFLSCYPNGVVSLIGYYKDIDCYSEITIQTDTIEQIDNGIYEITKIVKSFKSIKKGEWIYYNEKGEKFKEEFFQ